jgi:hypothetical protein
MRHIFFRIVFDDLRPFELLEYRFGALLDQSTGKYSHWP